MDNNTKLIGNSELFCNEDGEWDNTVPICALPSTTEWITESTTVSERLSTSIPSTTMIAIEASPENLHISSIPEEFWSEMRNFIFHGCQSLVYKSTFCKAHSKDRYADLSESASQATAFDQAAQDLLLTTSDSPSLPTLTIASLYNRLFVSNNNRIPEDVFRRYISFGIDNIVWNYEALALNGQWMENELTPALLKIMTPIYKNFRRSYKYEEYFPATPTLESTTIADKSCRKSPLPELPNGFHELIEENVAVYKCKDTFKMVGRYLVSCTQDGLWEITSHGSCQRKCGILQIPVDMQPLSKIPFLFLNY